MYELPVFMMAVKTNLDYYNVGVFIVENESIKSIAECLELFKSPEWTPRIFITDFDESEIGALELTFKGAIVGNYALGV